MQKARKDQDSSSRLLAKPPQQGVLNISLLPRNTGRRRQLKQRIEEKARSFREENYLNWPKYLLITLLIPGEITRIVHVTNLAWRSRDKSSRPAHQGGLSERAGRYSQLATRATK